MPLALGLLLACAPAAAPTATPPPATPPAVATPAPTKPAAATPVPTKPAVATPVPTKPAAPTPVPTKPAGATPASQAQTITVNLAAQGGSGVSGTATLTDLGGRTRVVVRVTPAGNTNMPAHIHLGTCANLNPQPRWPLTNVTNGESITEVPASLAEITSSQTAINLHKSPQEASVYVACGDIRAAS